MSQPHHLAVYCTCAHITSSMRAQFLCWNKACVLSLHHYECWNGSAVLSRVLNNLKANRDGADTSSFRARLGISMCLTRKQKAYKSKQTTKVQSEVHNRGNRENWAFRKMSSKLRNLEHCVYVCAPFPQQSHLTKHVDKLSSCDRQFWGNHISKDTHFDWRSHGTLKHRTNKRTQGNVSSNTTASEWAKCKD